MGEIMKRREAIRINDWNKLYEKYPIGNKALNKTQSELYRMWRDGRKDSDYKKFNEKNILYFLPFLELFLILFQIAIFITNSISKPRHWK